MFRLNLFIPLMIVVVLMSAFMVSTVIYFQELAIHKNKESISLEFEEHLNSKVTTEAAVLEQYIDFIEARVDIAKLFMDKDKPKLNSAIQEIFSRLNKNVELTHMYFISPDTKVLLRVHDYQRDQDIVKRMTLLKAKETKKLFYGLEFGPKKNYTLRIVKPWYFNGKLIGYLELGKEIDKIIEELSRSLKTEIYLTIKKDVYKNSSDLIKKQLAQKAPLKDYFIAYNTYAIPQIIEEILNETENYSNISFNGNDYFTSKKILSDVSGKNLGYFVFLSNVTLEYEIMHGAAKILSIILLLISLFLMIGGYFIIRKKEKSIYDLTSKLEAQKNVLSLYNVKLQNLFNLQSNMVLITNGKKIDMANQAMFDFFGYEDLRHFLSDYICICERFVQNDNFFHLGKIKDSENWIESMLELPEEDRIVNMLDDELIAHVFSVSFNLFDGENYLIALSDISKSVIETNKLKKKVSHDKLTGAFNREYFDTHIKDIIEEAHSKRLGMVICDIDYFKRINDTYGHNRGDVVLKDFTTIISNTIRSTDYLIRWGGEEFIILMIVIDIVSLEKASENIRTSIEKYDFEEVGTITASFGLTLHVEGESIVNTIGRMDKALYVAKDNGRNQSQVLLES